MAPKSKSLLLVYGATGYSGRLCVQSAVKRGLGNVLAVGGRNSAAVEAIAREFGVKTKICFDLKDDFDAKLEDVAVVLHIAGPYSQTAKQMVQACIRTHTHYLDITGEIDVFEMIHSAAIDAAAKSAGIVLIPGVGFDVVPTDCLASKLKDALPTATELHLVIGGTSRSASAGTLKTMIEGLSKPSVSRENNKLVPVGYGHKEVVCNFPNIGNVYAANVPWGDCSTAYYSTGIPNIYCYMPIMPKPTVRFLKWFGFFFRLFFMFPFVVPALQWLVTKFVKGPTKEQRDSSFMEVVGFVRDAATGKVSYGTLRCPEGYRFTADAAILAAERVLKNKNMKKTSGSLTPSMAFGNDFVEELEGVGVSKIETNSSSCPLIH